MEGSHGKEVFKARFYFNYFPCDGVTNSQVSHDRHLFKPFQLDDSVRY